MSLQQPLHRYDHLPDNSIRLLRLLPNQDEDAPIQCQLFNCSLKSSGGTRPYEALSYVWGSDHRSQSISIDSCYLPVRGNLFAALLHLRDPDIERILWIDAVCINQQDNMEKGHQVQSMAKIYAKATRVIVWLGKAMPDLDQALEDIRIAGLAPKQTVNENAILKLLEAAWFRRIWVLQEVAAARHIVIRCGPAEIDGYAFFSGLSALKLPYEDYPGLRLLVLSLAYLAKDAAFRSRCTTSHAGRFSLDICHLGQLVDMYHNRQASDNRDRIYALLGMCSDDPGASGLSVDYNISWAKLFKQLVQSILGSVPVDTWEDKAVAVIRSKGYILGIVSLADPESIDRNGKQQLQVTWNSSLVKWRRPEPWWELVASAEPVEEGDVLCLLQGATFPTIIRIHDDYWNIVVIAAASTMSDDKSEFPPLPTIFPYDLLLVWDWDLCLDQSQRGNEYKDLMGHLALKAPQARLQTDCEKITRLWNNGVAMQEVERSEGEENLRKAMEALEHVLSNKNSLALAGLGRDHRMMADDMKELQGIVDLISKEKGGGTALCLAAEAGYEAVARLLLDTDKVHPNTQDDWGGTSLSKAARKGHERIVKLLLSNKKVNPDARGDKDQSTPLAEAAEEGHEAIVELLINTGKVDVNALSFGRTPLMRAAANGHTAIVKILLSISFGRTPLMRAAANGHTAIVELLLSTSGVKPDFGYKPESGCYTALSLAVMNGHEAIVELLLGVSQVPLNFLYGSGKYGVRSTLLLIAVEKDYKGIIKLLERAMGSDTGTKD